jgi:hypothetical protein
MSEKPVGESDYKKMGMSDANLYVVYSLFGTVFALPGVVGSFYALVGKKAEAPTAKVSSIVAAGAGPMYLSWVLLKYCGTFINANLGAARRPTGVNVPDQHVYKVKGGSADGSLVLMDDSSKLFGPFNRAQRALQNWYEQLHMVVCDFLLAGYVFPVTASAMLAGFSVCRVKGAIDYAEDRSKRMSGNMASMIFAGGLAGINIAVGLRSTYLQFKK